MKYNECSKYFKYFIYKYNSHCYICGEKITKNDEFMYGHLDIPKEDRKGWERTHHLIHAACSYTVPLRWLRSYNFLPEEEVKEWQKRKTNILRQNRIKLLAKIQKEAEYGSQLKSEKTDDSNAQDE